MKRFLVILLAVVSTVSLMVPAVRAEEAEEEKLTHLELLEQLCTGFPYVGYEKYPEVPQYFQQDYAHVPYGGWNGNVATHGCGIAALAMLATYMTDTELTPADLAEPFRRYSSDKGTEFALFDDSPGMLGYYMEGRTKNWHRVKAALENGQMVVSLQFADHFTDTAHFIVLTGITENGGVMVMDSNKYNHTLRFAGTDCYENGFNPAYVHKYSEKYWIYEKKLVRVPGCTRCADPEVVTVPVCQKPHYCTKCTALLNKQDAYHKAVNVLNVKPQI